MTADVIYFNGQLTTLDPARPHATAVAIRDGRFMAVGFDEVILLLAGEDTRLVDLRRRTVIPGLNDSHLHLIRGGLNFNMELRWDGVPSLDDALRMLEEQARRTPPPQWVRVVGGWTGQQFAERRLPTLEEINQATGDTPCFILHLYDRAWLNGAALRLCGYTRDSANPPGGEIQRDARGNPTGLLVARPNASILYSTLAKAPKLNPDDAANSTRHFMREMNRLGLTSAIDAGGGFQNYPEDYQVVDKLAANEELTVRLAYNLFPQRPKQEREDFARWVRMTKPGAGSDSYRVNGAGEMLVFSAADFEDFVEPRPELARGMEGELEQVVRVLAANRWPFRLHATYNESITRMLGVFEKVNRDIPFDGLHWFFDHAETIDDRNMERVRRLGGGIAIQHRMAYQGEAFVERYGREAARQTPPFRRMMGLGLPVGAGTDATRVASYNPWVALYWLTTGRTVGGTPLYGESNLLSREEALRLYTQGSSWFSTEQDRKGTITCGQFADFTALSANYFAVPDEEIKTIESVLTVVGGAVVYGAEEFAVLDPPLPPVSPDWSPVRYYGGYYRAPAVAASVARTCSHTYAGNALWPGWTGCDCFAF
ncbi:MAG: amidohydrolase [Bryobacterales bacterium]|nr:amidohydrolase [Bryobacterales bacterium]